MRCTLTAIVMVAMALLTACNDRAKGLKPRSGGDPNDVVVTGGDTTAVAAVAAILSGIDAEGLPQREAAFDVKVVKNGIGPIEKYARCIVIADFADEGNGRTRIRYERDVYARHQIVVSVSSPSVEQLVADAAQTARSLKGLIGRFETGAELARLKKARNHAAEKAIDSITGHTIWVPEDMTAMKRGKDFVWISDNSATAMRNICVYTYPGTATDKARMLRMRDSVMRANIPGREPQMHMTTATDPAPTVRAINYDGRHKQVMRGLWEMYGDAMGGPFVSHSLTDSAKGRTVVAEAFVYAPGKKKRDLIGRLEAALHTLK